MGNTTGSCGCGHTTENTPQQDTTRQERALTTPPAPGTDDTAQCPVMAGTPVDKAAAEAQGLYRDHEGQRYWFCCPGCAPAFDADPAKYTMA